MITFLKIDRMLKITLRYNSKNLRLKIIKLVGFLKQLIRCCDVYILFFGIESVK